jgi:hypothetical protein
MTAATLVGLMSIPALAVLYGGLVQKKWAINTVHDGVHHLLPGPDHLGAVGLQAGLRHAAGQHVPR